MTPGPAQDQGPRPAQAQDPGPSRDRDLAGRPRNSRPRDALGRPLPRGETGAERVPEDLTLPPPDALALAQRLLDSGRPFDAHEVLEASWKQAPEPERELWRGLAQVAVGLTHLQRGNARGAVALLLRGADRVSGYTAAPPHGIDAAGIARAAAGLAALIETAGNTAGVSSQPRISLTRGAVQPPRLRTRC